MVQNYLSADLGPMRLLLLRRLHVDIWLGHNVLILVSHASYVIRQYTGGGHGARTSPWQPTLPWCRSIVTAGKKPDFRFMCVPRETTEKSTTVCGYGRDEVLLVRGAQWMCWIVM